MAAYIPAREEIVQPMACHLTQNGSDDRREVEIADLLGTKIVERRDEDGERRVDANYPGEGYGIIDGGDEHRKLRYYDYWTDGGLGERVAELA